MSPVTGLAQLAGQILPSVYMENLSPVTELRFQPGNCSYGKFQLSYRDEQGAICKVSSWEPGWSVHMGKFLAGLTRSRS